MGIFLGSPGDVLGESCASHGFLGAVFVDFVAVLGPSGAGLGGVLEGSPGSPGCFLEASWGLFEASWGLLGASWGVPSGGRLEPF